MPIGTAVQKGRIVVVNDLRGHQLYARVGELRGFTSLSVTIRHEGSHLLTIYDEQGRQLATMLAAGGGDATSQLIRYGS